MGYFGKPQNAASRGVTKIKGYANGGVVKTNTFRSDAEKKVDELYAPAPAGGKSNRARQLNDQIDRVEGGVRG